MQWINHYSRKDTNHHIKGSDTAANRRTLVIVPFSVVIDDRLGAGRLDTFTTLADIELDLNTAANWDTVTPIDYTVAATRAGNDFYYYACIPVSGNVPVVKLSANSTYPSGYTANNSRKIGGFHAMPHVTAPTWLADTVTTVKYVVQPVTPGATKLLYRCTARAGDYKTHAATEPTWPTTVGETVVDDQVTWTCDANGCENLPVGHPYIGFLMGDILFNSIWDLLDLPQCSPEGMVKSSSTPSNGGKALWVDIYHANGVGTTLSSVHAATVKASTGFFTFMEYGVLLQKKMISLSEFQIASKGSIQAAVVAGAALPATSKFYLDTTGRSIISNVGCIGITGEYYTFLRDSPYIDLATLAHVHVENAAAEYTQSASVASTNPIPALAHVDDSAGKGRVYHRGILKFVAIGGGALAPPASVGSHGLVFHCEYTGGTSNAVRFVCDPK